MSSALASAEAAPTNPMKPPRHRPGPKIPQSVPARWHRASPEVRTPR